VNLRIQTLAFTAAVIVSGCVPFGGSEGALDHGEFFYQCTTDGDIACDSHKADVSFHVASADGQKLPRAVAVGAPFQLVFQGADGGNQDALVQSSSPKLAPESDHGFAIEQAGTVSFLALGSGGGIADFIDITAADVDNLRAFHEGAGVTKIALRTGDTFELGAFPRDVDQTPLSGSLTWGWESADSTIASVGAGASDDPQSNETTIDAVAAGTTTITVRAAGKSLAIPVVVADFD
jgi:hypothetical protein